MSRETFIQSEDKELEVTFREVRNWDEYSDLDFEADTAPLTEQEAGTDSEDELLEESATEDSNESDEEVTANPVAEDGNIDDYEDIDEDVDIDEEEKGEDSLPVAESDAPEVDTEEEIAESDAPEVEAESDEDSDEEDSEETVEEGYASDTSQEAVVTLPVIEDNFEVEPAWEEPVTGDEDEETVVVDEESDEPAEEELPIGEKGEDTESLGESLESIYNLADVAYVEDEEEERKPQTFQDILEKAIESGEPILVGTVRDSEDYVIGELNFEKKDDEVAEEGEVVHLNVEESLELDPYALAPDTSEVDTFEAISGEDESLNKAETVEEIPAEYSEDTLPDTVAIETVESGDYFSFDDVELDSDDEKEEEVPAPAHEESMDEESDDDEELSLELDYSEDEDK